MGRRGQAHRRKIHLTHDGRTLSVAGWAEELHWNQDVIYERLRRGWPVDRVLTEPVKHGGARRPPRLLTRDGQTRDLRAWAADLGVSATTLERRLRRMPPEQALTGQRRTQRLYVFGDRSQGLRAWAAEMGIPLKRLERRLRLGWSLADALTTPRLDRGAARVRGASRPGGWRPPFSG